VSATEQRIVALRRSCDARLVPTGRQVTIPANTFVNLRQALGGSYTVTYGGNMARIDGTDADALGLEPELLEFAPPENGRVSLEQVWEVLRTIYDPEIPVSLVELGLIYAVDLEGNGPGENRVRIRMTLTAPGCGMGDVLVSDIRYRVGKVPFVCGVDVDIVFDPPWTRDAMSDEAKLQLGLF